MVVVVVVVVIVAVVVAVVVALSDHLWFRSLFAVEFATPTAVAVLGPVFLQLHRL